MGLIKHVPIEIGFGVLPALAGDYSHSLVIHPHAKTLLATPFEYKFNEGSAEYNLKVKFIDYPEASPFTRELMERLNSELSKLNFKFRFDTPIYSILRQICWMTIAIYIDGNPWDWPDHPQWLNINRLELWSATRDRPFDDGSLFQFHIGLK